MSKRRAFITGITGQDGSYLAEHLLALGYEVHGLVRRVATQYREPRLDRIVPILARVTLHPGSVENYASLIRVLSLEKFDEIYHLAAQSFVAESFDDGFATMSVNVMGTHHLLAAVRQLQPQCRVYFAGTSEMFGKVSEAPQRETTSFHPRSPYGISKVAGFELMRNYREAYGMFCATGILFNHESPRRGEEFVTRKITRAVAKISGGEASELVLGNLDAKRDWGHARDYVEAMHLILTHTEAKDFVVATGVSHSVRQFCELAFAHVGLDYRKFVRTDAKFERPSEVATLVGDASLARTVLGWQAKTDLRTLIAEMVDADLALVRGTAGGTANGIPQKAS